jgi:hypothetical protein
VGGFGGLEYNLLVLVRKDLVHGIGTGSDFTSKLVLVLGPRLIFAWYEVGYKNLGLINSTRMRLVLA